MNCSLVSSSLPGCRFNSDDTVTPIFKPTRNDVLFTKTFSALELYYAIMYYYKEGSKKVQGVLGTSSGRFIVDNLLIGYALHFHFDTDKCLYKVKPYCSKWRHGIEYENFIRVVYCQGICLNAAQPAGVKNTPFGKFNPLLFMYRGYGGCN